MVSLRQVNGIRCSQLTYPSALSICSLKTHPSLHFAHKRITSQMMTETNSQRHICYTPKHLNFFLIHQRLCLIITMLFIFLKNCGDGVLSQMNTNGIIGTLTYYTSLVKWKGRLCKNSHGAGFIQPKRKPLFKVHPTIYGVMFQKINYEEGTVKHCQDGRHSDDDNVLSRYVTEEESLKFSSSLYIGKSKPNWLVAYLKEGQTKYGWVNHIYSLPDLHGRILVVLKKLDDPFGGNRSDSSGSFQRTLGYLGLNFVTEGSEHLPAWTFKHHQPLVFLRVIPRDLSTFLSCSNVQ
ncbi:hypothetical protein VP01_2568g2 [Puccinia sorghi]|uniref:Uncharacterized protein n=1 Tax=Puccinia sorghi TaxID=27349 RepID=A0A0L6V504_9BASI|nr:hypothetical protein VP01_2568g2 [Puccinia sorghi]